MLGHSSTAARKGSDDAFDGTEKSESALMRRQRLIKFNTHCSDLMSENSSTLHWSETRSDVRDKMLVIQTCVTNICRFDTCQEIVEIFERNTRTESLPDDTCIETE